MQTDGDKKQQPSDALARHLDELKVRLANREARKIPNDPVADRLRRDIREVETHTK